jgi:hypothetical protein
MVRHVAFAIVCGQPVCFARREQRPVDVAVVTLASADQPAEPKDADVECVVAWFLDGVGDAGVVHRVTNLLKGVTRDPRKCAGLALGHLDQPIGASEPGKTYIEVEDLGTASARKVNERSARWLGDSAVVLPGLGRALLH